MTLPERRAAARRQRLAASPPPAPADGGAPLDLVFLGLSITSSWGNGHATTYRGLLRELARQGHRVLFLERDVPWYADNRDLARPPYGETALYTSLRDLRRRFAARVREADLVVVGSFVPEGVEVARWVFATARGATAFYDIDTPVTLARLAGGPGHPGGRERYLAVEDVPRFDLYLSFTGGPTLDLLERRYGARRARPLYCSFDPRLYRPEEREARWDLGYLGTYSDDRQPALDRLLLAPARRARRRRFVVAGPQYPESIRWPRNVERREHVAPADHRAFYCSQRFTLNVTRAAMIRAGWSPSVRLFEAAACAVPVISDRWDGIDAFFRPGEEILLCDGADPVLAHLAGMPDDERREIGRRARARVLAAHTAAHRAEELVAYAREVLGGGAVAAAG